MRKFPRWMPVDWFFFVGQSCFPCARLIVHMLSGRTVSTGPFPRVRRVTWIVSRGALLSCSPRLQRDTYVTVRVNSHTALFSHKRIFSPSVAEMLLSTHPLHSHVHTACPPSGCTTDIWVLSHREIGFLSYTHSTIRRSVRLRDHL